MIAGGWRRATVALCLLVFIVKVFHGRHVNEDYEMMLLAVHGPSLLAIPKLEEVYRPLRI